jgi:DNA polymerase
MDHPARPASAQNASEKVEAWLRYYDDLGVRLFYRDRPMSGALPESQNLPAAQAAEATVPKRNIPSGSAPSAVTAVQRTPQASPAAQKVDVVVRGPSLFESAERIVGDTLERISSDLGECTRCKLHKRRNKIVFGVGNPKAELVFVGEGPGHDEDLQGVPFVGRAGQLLTQMIEAMGLTRADVYIAKCRPPENRTPEKDEVSTCMPFLFRQLEAIQPKVVVCLGNVATQALLNTNKSISSFRGQWFDFRGSRLMATYHPAYLLRNPHAKHEVWADLKKVMAVLGLKPPRPKS